MIWARVIESEKLSRQWGVNFCRETSRCLAGPSGNGPEMDRNQALWGGTARGFVGMGVGVVREKENYYFFWVQNGSFSAFGHYKYKERLSRGLGVKGHIPSTCLDASRKSFSTEIYSKNRASEWPWL